MTVAWLERLSNTKNEELDPGLDPIRFFDDAGANELLKKVQQSQTTTDGMNTSPVDMFRQGVEITNNKFRFMTTQPKFWAGNIKHWVAVEAIGAPGDFTHFDNTNEFDDNKIAEKWNPVRHLDDSADSFMLFNEGYQQEFASSMAPLEIPGKSKRLSDPKRPITGMKQDGGLIIQQRVRLATKDISYFEMSRERFSDHGQGNMFVSGSLTIKPIYVQQWTDDTFAVFPPYHDEIQTDSLANPLIQQLTNASPSIISVLLSGSNLDLDESSEADFEFRSATAGNQYGDKTTARYGTDSIAFGGMLRGW